MSPPATCNHCFRPVVGSSYGGSKTADAGAILACAVLAGGYALIHLANGSGAGIGDPARARAEGRGQDLDDVAVYGREGVAPSKGGEIGIHALRVGAVVGEHRLVFYGLGEEVEVAHRALSRRIFADVALRAARFAASAEPGLYSMRAVLTGDL